MKEITKYQCEVCNTLYADKTECINCEANHKISFKISEVVCMSKDREPDGYPHSIILKFSDGKEIYYVR